MKTIENLFAKIYEGITDFVVARDRERAKLERLIAACDNYAAQREQKGLRLGTLHGQASLLIAEGKNPDKIFKEEREIKAEADQLDGLIVELREKAIPEQMDALKKSQDTLRAKLQSLVNEAKPEAMALFEKGIAESMEIHEKWGQGINSFREKIGIGLSDNPFEIRSFINLTPKESRLFSYIRFVEGREI